MIKASTDPTPPAGLEQFTQDYDATLNRGISLSGEGRHYFIERRVSWLKRTLDRLGTCPKNPRMVDFGCGAGASFSEFQKHFSPSAIAGIDISTADLLLAKRDFPHADLYTPDQTPATIDADLAYSNGTFHHIPVPQRLDCAKRVFRSLKPGGLFALWENNPWNPGTRWVMSRIPFDDGAITLSPPQTRKLLRAAGFEILRTDFLFIFPKMLSPLRALEPLLSRLPMGAQYQVLCRKP